MNTYNKPFEIQMKSLRSNEMEPFEFRRNTHLIHMRMGICIRLKNIEPARVEKYEIHSSEFENQ